MKAKQKSVAPAPPGPQSIPVILAMRLDPAAPEIVDDAFPIVLLMRKLDDSHFGCFEHVPHPTKPSCVPIDFCNYRLSLHES